MCQGAHLVEPDRLSICDVIVLSPEAEPDFFAFFALSNECFPAVMYLFTFMTTGQIGAVA